MEANEVIKMITGIGRIQAGRRVLWDGEQGFVENFQVKKNPLFPVCGRFKSSSYVNGNYYY